MKGAQFVVSGCKKSVEKLLERMNATESTFNEWRTERKELKNEIDNLKTVNVETVKEIEKLKSENRGIRKEVSGCKKSLENLLERINKMSQISMNCKKKVI